MSRSSAAPAQTYRSSTARTERTDNTRIRLLGDEGSLEVALDAALSRSWSASRSPELAYVGPSDEPTYAPYDPPARHFALPTVTFRHPAWLLGTLIAAFTLIAVVTPALASGKPRVTGKRLIMSGYPSAAQPVAEDAMAGVIDTTTAPPEPAAAVAPQPDAPAQAPQSGYVLTAQPSISVKQIEAVLSQYGSPASGMGAKLYDLGVRYGIDPAYALAFFVHESGCGTKGVARFTHSLGNIRWTAGFGNYEGYRQYDSWEAGFEDWYKLITELYIGGWNLRTVDAIVPVYAPSADNNSPPAYIASVKGMVDNWRGK